MHYSVIHRLGRANRKVPLSGLFAENGRPEAGDRLPNFLVLEALHHAFQLAGGVALQGRRCAEALDRLIDRLLDDADLVDGSEAEETIDALDEFALSVA